jgi:hypothetical protein
MGNKRSFQQYMDMVGLDTSGKIVRVNHWCRNAEWPEQAKPYYYDKKKA